MQDFYLKFKRICNFCHTHGYEFLIRTNDTHARHTVKEKYFMHLYPAALLPDDVDRMHKALYGSDVDEMLEEVYQSLLKWQQRWSNEHKETV